MLKFDILQFNINFELNLFEITYIYVGIFGEYLEGISSEISQNVWWILVLLQEFWRKFGGSLE